MANKSVSAKLKTISNMGSRTELGTLRIVNITFFIITLFFGLIYFVTAATADVAGNAIDVDVTSGLYLNIGVISATSFILLIMEFYPAITDLMKFVRLCTVVVLVVFVCLCFDPITQLADNATGSGEDAIVYVFASLTVGFSAIAGLLNVLEIMRHSGY
tara:strand:+ start:671 stop:1147 length:477 start_codon:yes stop_codon:yes gene_type:complete